MAPSSKSRAMAGAFGVLVALAFALGWPLLDGGESRRVAASLQQVEERMVSEARFHLEVDPPPYPGPSAFCGECHSLPPHPGGGATPAFLNHHATVFECLVCHWAAVSGSRPDLAWDRLLPADAEQGQAEGVPLVLRLGVPPDGESRDLRGLRTAVTGRQVCFDRGPACTDCHSRGRIGAYARPGKSEQWEANLEKLPEVFLMPEGRKWYFPHRP